MLRVPALLASLTFAGVVSLAAGCGSRHAPLVRTHTAAALACDADALTAQHLGGAS